LVSTDDDVDFLWPAIESLSSPHLKGAQLICFCGSFFRKKDIHHDCSHVGNSSMTPVSKTEHLSCFNYEDEAEESVL
jgi:hypothetical protein